MTAINPALPVASPNSDKFICFGISFISVRFWLLFDNRVDLSPFWFLRPGSQVYLPCKFPSYLQSTCRIHSIKKRNRSIALLFKVCTHVNLQYVQKVLGSMTKMWHYAYILCRWILPLITLSWKWSIFVNSSHLVLALVKCLWKW